MTTKNPASSSTRVRGPGRRRVMASVASSPRHSSSTQNAPPGATRTTLLPGGVRISPDAATASASATSPASAPPSRNRASRASTATSAASSSPATQPQAPAAGSTASSERGSPGRIRLALNSTNGGPKSASTPTAVSSTPSASGRRRDAAAGTYGAATGALIVGRAAGAASSGSPRR